MEVKKMTFKDKRLHRPWLISCQLPVNHHNYEVQAPEQPHEVFVCVTLLTVNSGADICMAVLVKENVYLNISIVCFPQTQTNESQNQIATAFQQDDPIPFHSYVSTCSEC
jgi:hypothetical protein